MASESYSRHIPFEEIINFRDLGGYRNGQNREIVWRKVFRSGELEYMTAEDARRIQEELSLRTIIDLRSRAMVQAITMEGPFARLDIRKHNIPFIPEADRDKIRNYFQNWTSWGEYYVFQLEETGIGERIVNALEIIADPANHPLLFHCAAGKDRTGVLAAMILSILGVSDQDIIEDYARTVESIHLFAERQVRITPAGTQLAIERSPFLHDSPPEAMEFLINTLGREYGSMQGYLEAHGADASLFGRIKDTLLD